MPACRGVTPHRRRPLLPHLLPRRPQYAFAATPLSGGATVTAVSASPEARLRGLQPGTEYSVVVVGALPSGQATPTSAALLFATPAAGAAVLARAVPTGSSSAALVLNAPLGGPSTGAAAPDSYLVQMCPAGQLASGGACPAATCPGGGAACNVVGLQPGTVYDVGVTAVSDGQRGAASATTVLVTPAAGLPALVDAQPSSPTSALAVAKPPDNATFVSVRVALLGMHSRRGRVRCLGSTAAAAERRARLAADLRAMPRLHSGAQTSPAPPSPPPPCSTRLWLSRSTAAPRSTPRRPRRAPRWRACRQPPCMKSACGPACPMAAPPPPPTPPLCPRRRRAAPSSTPRPPPARTRRCGCWRRRRRLPAAPPGRATT